MDASVAPFTVVSSTTKKADAAIDSPGLRIEEIRVTPVNIRLLAPYRWAAGIYNGRTNAVVEVRTADGTVGLGEAANWRHAALIGEEIAPRILGEPGTDLRRCRALAVPPVAAIANVAGPEIVRAFGAVEMALWDIRGKALGLPLHQLLGGPARDRVPFTEYFAPRPRRGGHGGEETPAELAAYCERAVGEWGSPYFEGKVGWSDLGTDVALVTAVREAIGPGRMLKLDANGGWRPATAREALRRFADLGVDNVEDPAPTPEEMARLRAGSAIPFSTHVPDLRAAVRLGVPDTFVLNATALGGIERTMRFVAACQEAGRGFSFYSGDSGIGVAAYLQMAAADPFLDLPSQSLLRWYANDVIVGGPFQATEGHIAVPRGPGLGVELDADALAEAHEDFLVNGEVEQSGTGSHHQAYVQLPRY